MKAVLFMSDVAISGICIQETKYFIPCRAINKSVDIG